MTDHNPDAPPTSMVPRIPITLVGPGTPDEGERRGVNPIPSGTTVMAQTPDHHPDLVVTFITPALAILVRFINTFLVQFVGLLVAAMTPAGGHLLYTSDFFHAVMVCANLALPGAGLGLAKDLVTIFGRLEGKYPLLTGSV
jgi:hypothetical protein